MKRLFIAAHAITVAIAIVLGRSAIALDFSLTFDSSMDPYPQARAGVEEAAAMWKSVISTPVTVSINVHAENLFALASTDSNLQDVPYGDGRAALMAHATSADDAVAVAHLPPGPTLEFLGMIPQGYRVFNHGDRYINHYLNMSKANVRALGLPVAQDVAPDADIYIGQYYLAHNSFDYNRRDGVSGLDFVGVVSHEIGHALGFFSGVDDVDYYSLPNGPKAPDDLNEYSEVTTLDLFRYTTQSKPLFDLTPGGEPYFSLDGGQTSLGRFSSGVFNGDGWQASHWYAGTGLMGPYVQDDQLQPITALDRQAFDVIGWDLRAALAGDFNRDSHVDAADLQAMLGALSDLTNFQIAAGLSDTDLLTIGDLNGDGAITNADVSALLNLLIGGSGSLAAVPEPASVVLLALALPGLVLEIARSRRSSLRYRLEQ